ERRDLDRRAVRPGVGHQPLLVAGVRRRRTCPQAAAGLRRAAAAALGPGAGAAGEGAQAGSRGADGPPPHRV
ncbi:MAG: hypothetical protein AVDCRST_MAG68-5098, partial [uncultured Gemmatimonadetes bacterium]